MKKIEDLTAEEVRAELRRIRDTLSDIEDMHAFTFVKTTAHIGAETAQRMQEEYEQERNALLALIEPLENRLQRASSGDLVPSGPSAPARQSPASSAETERSGEK